jgi:hypothetical protein
MQEELDSKLLTNWNFLVKKIETVFMNKKRRQGGKNLSGELIYKYVRDLPTVWSARGLMDKASDF